MGKSNRKESLSASDELRSRRTHRWRVWDPFEAICFTSITWIVGLRSVSPALNACGEGGKRGGCAVKTGGIWAAACSRSPPGWHLG